MKRYILFVLVIAALFASVYGVLALGPAPSWQLTQGAPGTCSSTDGFSMPGVEINIPSGAASEQGTLSAPGYPSLGYTVDGAFGPFVGPHSFFVFVSAPYSLPANTPITLSVTTYNGTGYAGGVSYVSTVTWDCTTGALIVTETADCPNPLPAGAVVGEAPAGAQVYWAPSADKASPGIVLSPGTYQVIGVDETGEYSKIWLTCNSQFWVRSDTLQPSYQAPQNGEPLPTNVVS